MKKTLILSIAALSLAACSDSMTSPFADPGEALFTALHTTIPAPVLNPSTTSNSATIGWTWSDNEGWNKLVSVTLKRDGVAIPAASQNVKPYLANSTFSGSYTDSPLAPGTYVYCLEVMAKHEHGQDEANAGTTVTHHNSACRTVVIASYTVSVIGGSAGNGTFNKTANNFNLTYQLKLGSTVVTDCSMVVTVVATHSGGSAAQAHNTCDSLTGSRQVQFSNTPTKGTATNFTVTFSFGGGALLGFPVSSN